MITCLEHVQQKIPLDRASIGDCKEAEKGENGGKRGNTPGGGFMASLEPLPELAVRPPASRLVPRPELLLLLPPAPREPSPLKGPPRLLRRLSRNG